MQTLISETQHVKLWLNRAAVQLYFSRTAKCSDTGIMC